MSVNDPYKVLEISPEATDEEVKTAYREMARKYHPDNYANNPLSDLAQEKMQEINEAYDTILIFRMDILNINMLANVEASAHAACITLTSYIFFVFILLVFVKTFCCADS